MMNSDGTITLTREEMLELWRLRRHLKPLSLPASVTRADGLDSEALIESEMNRWYEEQLLTLPADRLPLSDVTQQCEITPQPDGSWLVTLPPSVIRVVAVEIEGWLKEAIIETDPASALATAQLNPFARGNEYNPVAVIQTGRMSVYTPPANASQLKKVMCVARPASGTYILTRTMMPPLFNEPTDYATS